MKQTKQIINIVLVEDNQYYNRLLTKYVNTICSGSFSREFEFNIISFLSAHDAIEQMDDDWNIIVLDYFLFNSEEDDILSGADVMKELSIHCPECKVIIVSGMKNQSKIVKLKESGIYAYVDKNVSSLNRVGSLLQTILDETKLKRA